jgi:D-glycero-alpha-D-manno-heptose-7-phosphate kinase
VSTPHPRPTIRARVPLRLGLAGGGTDLSPYCDEFGGAVLNTTIDRYAYAFIDPSPDDQIHVHAPDLGVTGTLGADLSSLGKLALHAGVAARMARTYGNGVLPPLRLTSYVDAPPGSGLGSSSALVVALVEAFAVLLSAPLGPYDVARSAWEIERLDLCLPGGRQDQYAATFGGTNFIEFLGDQVIVNPLRVAPDILHEVEASLAICFTGMSRRSDTIIAEQQAHMLQGGDALAGLHRLKADAQEMKQALLGGDIPKMAAILNRSWEAKKRTAGGISTEQIESLHRTAFAHGAIGGKVSGAGGGGFMVFIVPPERRVGMIRALNAAGGEAAAVHLTGRGAKTWRVVGTARAVSLPHLGAAA